MPAWLIVRAEVSAEDRDAFDRWYEAEHLPQAREAFGALSARRGWSDAGNTERRVHLAIYEFPDSAGARAVLGSAAMQALIADFDRAWQGRVSRTREIVEIAQQI